MNETILSKTTQMLLRERLDRAERARVVRSALDHRAARKARSVKARRSTCRKSEQPAY
jgi:hypothetical protein